MAQTRRTAQRAEIVPSGFDNIPALHGAGGSESYETPVSSAKGQVIRLLPMIIV